MTSRLATPAALLVAVIAAGCAGLPGRPATQPPDSRSAKGDTDQLREWLTGTFVSGSRAGAGGAVRHMRVRPVLATEPGDWLYVVQWQDSEAVAERQFVYHLQGDNGDRGLSLEIYSLRRPLEHPTNPADEALAALDRDQLARRRGCRIRLSQDGLSFVGGTRGRDCPAAYRGADTLRIELTVRDGEVREWLQGYDADGERLWGTQEGGWVYRRVEAR